MDERPFNEEQLLELQKDVRNGRAAQVTLNFLEEFLLQERAKGINDIETGENYMYENLLASKLYLMVLRKFENFIKSFIDMGEVARKDLKIYGEQY